MKNKFEIVFFTTKASTELYKSGHVELECDKVL